MRIHIMTEPASTAVGGIALYKLLSLLFGATVAAVVVMIMTRPKSTREWAVALISTVVSSISGGAFLVRWLGIGSWVQDDIGLIALIGVVFVCGLPAWVIVRAWFAWSESRKDKALPEMVKEFREETGL
jgi:Cu/Ag efflux pump CusA